MQWFLPSALLAATLALVTAAPAQITNVIGVNINSTTNRIFDAIDNPNPPPSVSGTTNFYTFTVSTALTVTDVDLRLSILHSSIDDLDIFLISPTGVQVAMTNYTVFNPDPPSGFGDNFQDTYIDEEGGVLRIGSGTNPTLDKAPYAGPEYGGVRYKPSSALDTLTKFNGINPLGTWTLRVVDFSQGDDGILLWQGANPQALDDLLSDSASQIGTAWGTNAIGTQLIITTIVPEPGPVMLAALGLAGVGLVVRRARRG